MSSQKENTRICAMCGSSPSKDPSITLHRFPKPGSKNALRCELWAKYCFPNEAWSSPKFQDELHAKHKMLCSKHFESTCFNEKKLFRTAIPGVQSYKKRQVHLTPEQAAELYKTHYGSHHFPHLVAHMSSGPIIALVLATKNCITKWRTLMGPAMVLEAQAYWPDSLRACYGRRTKYGDYFNGLHGSENHAEALREIHFFFPNMIVGPLVRHWQVNDYIQKHLTPTLLPALTALAHERPAEPILWLAEHLRRHNPNEPELAPQPSLQRDDKRCHTPQPSEESVAK